jgi:hypothetical protein
VPLTSFQSTIAKAIAINRSEDSHLAGGAALHFSPRSKRYSNDLDYFHDSEERVAAAFRDDQRTLAALGYEVSVVMNLPGFVRAIVKSEDESTKVEWSRDSSWRFMPPVKHDDCGFVLHEIDVAVNKLLALAGRDEPRDFIDILYINENILPLGALCMAAVGKDPGFSPGSLLQLIRRRGRYREEDFARLRLTKPVNLVELKSKWLEILDEAERFIRSRPAQEAGSLYFSKEEKRFIEPAPNTPPESYVLHFGSPGGVLPKIAENSP